MQKTLTITTALLAVALLSGCSGGDAASSADAPSASGTTRATAPAESSAPAQTTAEACASVESDIAQATDSLTASGRPTEPSAMADRLTAFVGELRSANADVTNDQVHAAVQTVEDEWTAAAETLRGVSGLDDPAFAQAGARAQSAIDAYSSLCS
ncbi:hypothetical protein ACLBWP_18180 [Microbacterium sp. M1A1_1b]